MNKPKVKATFAALSVALIAGCGGPSAQRPLDQQYTKQPWARISVYEANAICENDVISGNSANMPLCMAAKGWQER